MADQQSSENTTTTTTKFEVHGPGNWFARISGAGVQAFLVVIIILLVSAALGYQAWENSNQAKSQIAAAQTRDEERAKGFYAQHAVTHELLRSIAAVQAEANKQAIASQQKTERAISVQTFVIAQDEKQRKALNLQMPDELRYNADRRPR